MDIGNYISKKALSSTCSLTCPTINTEITNYEYVIEKNNKCSDNQSKN